MDGMIKEEDLSTETYSFIIEDIERDLSVKVEPSFPEEQTVEAQTDNAASVTVQSGTASQDSFSQLVYPYEFVNVFITNGLTDSANSMSHVQCKFCSKRCKTIFGMYQHLETHSNNKEVPQCGICKKQFKGTHQLDRHMKIHNGVRDFACDVCGVAFTQKCHMERHKKLHIKFPSTECKICFKELKTIGGLQAHLRKGHNAQNSGETLKWEKRLTCTICEKRFSTNQQLKIHMLIHFNEKPFQCSVCKKKFRQKPHLKRHSYLHMDEKQFECTVCSKKYSSKCSLKIHEMGHLSERPFNCEICSKGFVEKRYYQRHKEKCILKEQNE